MNQLSMRDLDTHVPIVGWLLIVSNAIFLVIGVFVFLLLTGIGAVSGEREAFAVLSIVGTSVGVLLAILAVPGMAAGIGVLRRRSWGRILAIVVSVLSLLNFPIGTVIGLYVLWVLLQQSATEYFGSTQTL